MSTKVPTRTITLDEKQVKLSSIGLGCMSLSVFGGGLKHPEHPAEDASLEVIGKALEYGVNLFNSANFYGSGHNEVVLGKAIKKFGREKFFIADKFGQIRDEETGQIKGYDCSPEGVKKALEGSLERLGTDYVDVYIPARVDPKVPIEDTVGALHDLQKAGKIRHIGLSEANAATIRRAHKVAPISFLEIEYSLWTTDIEAVVLPTCRELGIKILAYAPLGRGFLTGTAKPSEMAQTDMRLHFPRFQEENLKKNAVFLQPLEEIAARLSKETGKDVKPGNVALAWVLSRGDDIFPIPGTKRAHIAEENFRVAEEVKLSAEDVARLEKFVKEVKVAGERYPGPAMLQDLTEDGQKL